jgi:hypothetical protein
MHVREEFAAVIELELQSLSGSPGRSPRRVDGGVEISAGQIPGVS